MQNVKEKLWRKETSTFIIEILVGQSWVRYNKTGHMTLPEAEREAQGALILKGVQSVRVVEIETIQTCTVVVMEDQNSVAPAPYGMRKTNTMASCPKCHESTPVSFDGTTKWTVCGPCSCTLPIG
jgi:hypothetical protein